MPGFNRSSWVDQVEKGTQLEMSDRGTLRSVERWRVDQGMMRPEDRSGRNRREEVEDTWEGRGVTKVTMNQLTKSQQINTQKRLKGKRKRGGERMVIFSP